MIQILNRDYRDVIASLAGQYSIIITDPPYNISKADGAIKNLKEHRNIPSKGQKRKDIEQDFGKWDYGFSLYDFQSAIEKDRVPIIVFTSHILFGQWIEAFQKMYEYNSFAVWHKTNPVPQVRKVTMVSSVELIAIGGRPDINFGKQNEMHNCFEGPIETQNRVHPTQKPLWLMKRIIQTFTKPDDIILDPFMGSGTTLVAAQELGRSAIGIEISPEYCVAANKRLMQQAMVL